MFPSLFGQLHWSYTSNFFGTDVLSNSYKERALMGTYLKLAQKNNNNVTILSNQKKNAHYKWNPV